MNYVTTLMVLRKIHTGLIVGQDHTKFVAGKLPISRVSSAIFEDEVGGKNAY